MDVVGIKQISCNHHTAAINDVGALYFWGTSVFGTFYEPRIVIDADIIEVCVGGSFGIAKDKDGLLWSWGQNSHGELGQQDMTSKLYPHPIVSLKRKSIKTVVCGGAFVIAIGQDCRKRSRRKSSARICSTARSNSKSDRFHSITYKENVESVNISRQRLKSIDNVDLAES